MDLQQMSAAQLDALQTEAVQQANALLDQAREISRVKQEKLGQERAAEEAARILADASPAARELMRNALIKGETASNDAAGKAGNI